MSDPIDKALDEYLGGSSQVSQRYREIDDAVVPAQLDQVVLARARAAVASQQASSAETSSADELERLRQRRKRLMRWTVPTGLAASALLVVAIVMQSGVQHEVVSRPQQRASPPAAVEERTAAQEPTAVQEKAERSSDKQRQFIELRQVSPPPPPQLASPPDQPPAAALSRTETEKVEASAKRLRQPPQESPVAVAAPSDLVKESMPSVVAPVSAPMVENVHSGAAIEPTTAISQSTKAQGGLHGADTASDRDERPESRVDASQADYDVSEVAVTGSRASRRAPVLAGPRGTVPAASAKSLPDEAKAQAQVVEEPDHWLERIRQLRRDGKAQDADGEWKHFREAYPDYAVAETDAARGKR